MLLANLKDMVEAERAAKLGKKGKKKKKAKKKKKVSSQIHTYTWIDQHTHTHMDWPAYTRSMHAHVASSAAHACCICSEAAHLGLHVCFCVHVWLCTHVLLGHPTYVRVCDACVCVCMCVQGKKDKKGKKKKDPTSDRSIESLFAELVTNGILQPCPAMHVQDYMGSSSFMQVHTRTHTHTYAGVCAHAHTLIQAG